MIIVITSTMSWAHGMRKSGTNDWHIDTKDLSSGEFDAVRQFAKENPDKVRFPTEPKTQPVPALKPIDTRQNVVQRPTKHAPFVDPITRVQEEDLQRQIDQSQAEDRLLQYQIHEGLVDDEHNATLIKNWISTNMQSRWTSKTIDQAVRCLKGQLHVKKLSEFTKRLAGF